MYDYYAASRRYVLCYDVPDNHRRARLVKCLSNYGSRTQKSIFEAVLDTRLFSRMERDVLTIINPTTESFFAYYLCAACENRVRRYGTGVDTSKGREMFFIA